MCSEVHPSPLLCLEVQERPAGEEQWPDRWGVGSGGSAASCPPSEDWAELGDSFTRLRSVSCMEFLNSGKVQFTVSTSSLRRCDSVRSCGVFPLYQFYTGDRQ